MWKYRLSSMTVLYLSLFLIGCTKEKKDEFKFVEYIEVKGVCSEEHVKKSAKYAGSIVHWHNLTKNTHARYGSVFNWDAIDPERLMEYVNDQYKYVPPFSIEFIDLTEDEISKDNVIIKGISEHIATDEKSKGPRYRATCNLKVVRRLDYLPSTKERKVRY